VRDRLGEHAYETFLASEAAGDFLQTLAWGRVKALTGWRSLPLLVQDDRGEVVLSALVLARRIPGLPLTLLYAPRGPVLNWRQPRARLEGILKAFVAAVPRLDGGGGRGVLLKCDPALPADNADGRAALAAAGFRSAAAGLSFEGVQPRFVYEIDITRPADELLASFGAKHRYNIRLAGRRGVTVREASDDQDLAEFYRLLQITAVRDGFGIRAYSYYQAIWREVVAKGGAKLFLAEHEGKMLSAALIFVLGERAWYVYGASGNEGRQLMPNYALHWHIIRWCQGRGLKVYDMRGISGDFSPDSRLYGLFRFKRGFCGRVVEYAGEYDLPLVPPLYWAARAGVPAIRWLMKKVQSSRRGGQYGREGRHGRRDSARGEAGDSAGERGEDHEDA
jgi:lipid II:glycine glycyltransferase (peptidoglycan interpeptide bridge formation enzyme)